jgi:hypothetical protein
MLKKKSQIWTIDMIAGLTIFLLALVVYFIFSSNVTDTQKHALNNIYNDAATVSSILMTKGTPTDWNNLTVQEIGITNGNYRLNESKFHNLSAIEYGKTKLLFKTKYDYLVFFENRTSEVLNISGVIYIGETGLTKDNIKEIKSPENLISIKRYLIYNSDIVTMVVYLWQ